MKIFVASTYQDLQDYRAAATRSILMAGNLSEDMSYWPAGDSPPLDVSRSRLKSSDLMILLLAHRYGTPPKGHDRSITELEFDLAVSLNLPILAFCVDPEYPWPPRHMETEPGTRTRLETFLQRVSARVTIGAFTTPESLEVAITHALVHFVGQQRPATLSRYAEGRLVQISRAESLRYSPDAVIKVGHAPDGASQSVGSGIQPGYSHVVSACLWVRGQLAACGGMTRRRLLSWLSQLRDYRQSVMLTIRHHIMTPGTGVRR